MPELSSQTHIRHHAIRPVIEKLRAEHSDVEVDTGIDDRWEFRTHYGALSAILDEGSVLISVRAEDETCLSYMKMAVAGHLAEHLGDAAGIRWEGDGDNSGTPVFFRELSVVSSERMSPHLQRVRFAADDIGRFAKGGLHVRLLLPPPDRAPVWPTLGENGLLVWPSGADALIVRVYTIRALDVARGWVEVDFVIHPGGETPAADFALAARPGQVIGMIGPGGGGVPDASNVLLLGDDTALPAIARILDEMPPGTEADVFLEVDGPADRSELVGGDTVRVTWLYRQGREPGTAGLLPAALRSMEPATLARDLYIWAGCEFADFREIRRILRKEWGLKKDRHLAVAYWRRGVVGHDGGDE